MNRFVIHACGGVALLCALPQAQATNWLMLQGTEAESAAPRAKVWGIIQAQYQKDYSDANATDGYIPPKLLGPDLDTQDGFNINRARLAVRGAGFPLDGKINYFLMAELGNNAITSAGNSFAKLTDASVTFNHIPGARTRVGLFKTPGSEEVYQGIINIDYINFTEFGNQQLIERLPNDKYTNNKGATTLPVDSDNSLNTVEKPVAAARDTGIQVFDTFIMDDWEHSYAVMLGNGNGLSLSDNDDSKDLYLYWSSEKVFGGKGPRREGWKLFGWHQDGTRLLDNTNDDVHNPQEYDRTRWGLGTQYRQMPFRLTFEYRKADGMIFVGPDKMTFDQNVQVSGANPGGADGAEGKAWGAYLEGGWYIPQTNWELDARYEYYSRLTDDSGHPAGYSFESIWKTLTLGVQYHFNKKTRVTFNYAFRDVETPDFAKGAGPNANMDGIGDRLALQVTAVF
ncbi:MAG: phosphate-selective porin O and P [Candidatus Thiodiazotropha sp.]